jgi:hypothetical protein
MEQRRGISATNETGRMEQEREEAEKREILTLLLTLIRGQ